MKGVNRQGEWLIIKRYVVEEIGRLRDELEHGGDDHQRGQIAALRKLIAEVEPEKIEPTEDDEYTADPQ